MASRTALEVSSDEANMDMQSTPHNTKSRIPDRSPMDRVKRMRSFFSDASICGIPVLIRSFAVVNAVLCDPRAVRDAAEKRTDRN